jgi:hypothetical protein
MPFRVWNYGDAADMRLNTPLTIEYFRRLDQPDVYLVKQSKAIKYFSGSSVTPWLAAARIAQRPYVRAEGLCGLSVQLKVAALPLVVGLLASVFQYSSPRPAAHKGSTRDYHFPSSRMRDAVWRACFGDPYLSEQFQTACSRLVLACLNSEGPVMPLATMPGASIFRKTPLLRPVLMTGMIPVSALPLLKRLKSIMESEGFQ